MCRQGDLTDTAGFACVCTLQQHTRAHTAQSSTTQADAGLGQHGFAIQLTGTCVCARQQPAPLDRATGGLMLDGTQLCARGSDRHQTPQQAQASRTGRKAACSDNVLCFSVSLIKIVRHLSVKQCAGVRGHTSQCNLAYPETLTWSMCS